MEVSEVEKIFNQLPSSDRLYLLCKFLQGSVTYELNFLSIVLQSYLKEKLNSVSEIDENANTLTYYSTKFSDTKIASKEPLEILSACLSLIRHDNQQVGDVIYKLLDQPDILNMAEDIEDFGLFENLRLVYIMSVYHPSMSFEKRHRLLTVYLHQLDEIFNSKVAEKNAREVDVANTYSNCLEHVQYSTVHVVQVLRSVLTCYIVILVFTIIYYGFILFCSLDP